MTDLSISSSNVVADAKARVLYGSCGETITAGQAVYISAATKKWMRADSNSPESEVRKAIGIALNGGSLDQPLRILRRGKITIGATLVPGTAYYLSDNPGGICTAADVVSGDYICQLGLASSSTVLDVAIQFPNVIAGGVAGPPARNIQASQNLGGVGQVATGTSPIPYPLDAFSGPSALAAWGTFAWTSSAIGNNAITTNDGSAANLTLGSGGFVSTGTGQRVSKIWPQVGSCFVDQTTLANRPTLWASVREGWPEVRFHQRLGTAATEKILNVQTPPTARSGQDWTHVMVVRCSPETAPLVGADNSTRYWNSELIFSLTSSPFSTFSQCNQETGDWSAFNRVYLGTGGFVDSNAPARANLTYSVVINRFTSSGVDIFVDGNKFSLGGTITTNSVQPYKYGQVNDFGGLFCDTSSYLGSAWFQALTDAQIVELTGLIRNKLFGGSYGTRSIWMFDGDSITAGFDVSLVIDLRDQSWPYLLMTNLSAANRSRVTGINMACASAHLETTASTEHRIMTNQAGKINAHLSSSGPFTNRVVVLCAGTNDIYGGTTNMSTVVTKLSTYRTAALAAGATRCLICTQIPRQGFDTTLNGYRTTLNSSILSTFGADAIDVAAQNWQPGGSTDWTTNYQDGIHPNAAGRALFVNAISSVMSGLA